MKNKVLTVGIIGMGIGKYHADAVVRTEKAALTWICDLDEELLADMKDKFKVANTCTDYREMLKDPDLDCVIIGTPDQLHKKMTEEALAAGKHVLCEKPMALSTEQCDEMIAAAEKNGKRLMIGQCLRFHNAYSYLKDCTDNKNFGKLKNLYMYRRSAQPRWAKELTGARTSSGVCGLIRRNAKNLTRT